MKSLIQISAAALLVGMTGACAQEATTNTETADMATTDMDSMATPEAAGTIVEVAQSDPQFSTLVSAVTAAGLGETLSGPGPFTVFAPTNAAFEKVDSATLGSLMEPANKEKLAGILTYHVVSGNVNAAALTKMIADNGGTAELTTVNGEMLTAKADGGTVTLTDAAGNTSTVTATDVPATNGVIHAIDTVLMPS